MKRHRKALAEEWINLKTEEIRKVVERYSKAEIRGISKLSGGVVNLNLKIKTTHQDYVLRIYRYKSEPKIETELNLIDFLRKNNFPTPGYFKDRLGCRVQTFNSNYGVLFEFVKGVRVKEREISLSHVQEVGGLLGKLHLIGKDFSLSKNRWSGDIKSIKMLYQRRKDKIRAAVPLFYKKIKKHLDLLSTTKETFCLPEGLVHGDIRIENFIFSSQGKAIALLDFDDFYYGYLLTDVATAIYFCCFEKERLNKEKMEILISAYQNYRYLSKREKELMMEFLKFITLKNMFYGVLICAEGNLKFGKSFALQGANRFESLQSV